MRTSVEKLIAARDLVARPGGWRQGFRNIRKPDCLCAGEALERVYAYDRSHQELLVKAAGYPGFDVVAWNDMQGRTQEQIISAFDRAIELARVAQ